MAEKRILGKLGDTKFFIGHITAVNEKSKNGKKIFECLIARVKFKDGQKISHMWINTHENIKHLDGKTIRGTGKVRAYFSKKHTAGTTLQGVKIQEVL